MNITCHRVVKRFFLLLLIGIIRSMKRDGEKIFEYCENSRLDGLLKLEVTSASIRETFEYRKDRLEILLIFLLCI